MKIEAPSLEHREDLAAPALDQRRAASGPVEIDREERHKGRGGGSCLQSPAVEDKDEVGDGDELKESFKQSIIFIKFIIKNNELKSSNILSQVSQKQAKDVLRPLMGEFSLKLR